MSFVYALIIILHLLCWAVALGTWIAAARTREPNPGMAHAAAGALVTGLILASIVSITGDPNHMKLGVKALIAIIVTVLAFIARKKGPQTSSAVWYAIPAAIVINVVVAVLV